jgi:hypothetical protein
MDSDRITTSDIDLVFRSVVTDAGGTLVDVYRDSTRIIARAVLPWAADVRPGDEHVGGIALRANLDEAVVHPYVVRQVCTNGAIRAQAIHTRRVDRLSEIPQEEALSTVRQAVRAGAVEEAFTSFVDEIASTVGAICEIPFLLMATLPDQVDPLAGELYTRVLAELVRGGDRSRFGLLNAVTAVARNTQDPELRWQLEVAGGAISDVGKAPTPRIQASKVRCRSSDRVTPLRTATESRSSS